ncbi:MAG TPA: RNA polymerase factor sigma-54 [Flavobacteriales bacterium]|nr:RNA polymerase factor sigma-54 [Flavobacteriales bacterium]
MALRQTQSFKLLQKLSPQQIQLMKLLQVPTSELEQRIKEELEINPALEEGEHEDEKFEDEKDEFSNEESDKNTDNERDYDIDDYLQDDTPDYKLKANNYSADDDEKVVPIAQGESYQEVLIEQLNLRNLTERHKQIGAYIIGNLDEDGYVRREMDALVDDLAFSQNIQTDEKELEKILHLIQQLDPPGIGARSLQECLILQLKRSEEDSIGIEVAITVLEKCFEEFSKKHYDKIVKKLHINEESLKEAIDEIIKLNPKPGGSIKESSKNVQTIIPDFFVTEDNGKLELTLNSRNAPQLKISRDYAEMLKDYAAKKGGADDKSKEAVQFVRQRIDSAKWFIDAIMQRQQTLLLVMNTIMQLQHEYFVTGDETKLRPMILKDIAEIVGMDISTVSRVANSKYVQTHFGTFLLKTFFSESLQTEAGEEVSAREVKKILSDAIGAEEKKHPLTDDELAKLLKDKGYTIARRTVAKYREQLNIPVARMRKEM